MELNILQVCHEKFVKMNQELGRHQQMYRELVSTGQTSSPTAEVIQKKMDSLMTRYLSLKAALLIPSTLENSFLFGALTGSWMIQLAFHTGISNQGPRNGFFLSCLKL